MPPKRAAIACFLLCSAILIGWCARLDFARQGDGWEYMATLEAVARHASVNVRPSDLSSLFAGIDTWRLREPGALPARDAFATELPHSFVTSVDGRAYARHFWIYSLVAVPARWALRLAGGREFNALVVTNAWLFAAAIAMVLAAGAGCWRQRLAFVLLAGATPVVWYLTFTGVEVFCWSLAVVALVALDRGWYWASALATGLAATQNPPMVFLAAVPVVMAATRHEPRQALAALLAASVAVVPVAFTWSHFGAPTLIATTLDFGLISISRTVSLLLDLNTGLLPYLPVLLVAAPWSAWRLIRRQDLGAALVVLALVGMLLAVQTQVNWNSDGRGLRRYLVWMLPPLAWLVVRAWSSLATTRWVAAAVITSGTVLAIDRPSDVSWLEHGPLARWVMCHAPALYNPDFEVFAERSAHRETPAMWLLEGRRDGWVEDLPVAHGYPSGEVTKLLVQRASAVDLPRRFRIDPSYRTELLRRAEASATPTYVHPPRGMVWATPGTIDGIYTPYSGRSTAPLELTPATRH
ncbi:MAG: hypothetical protein ABI880_10635 [Acidobacteriota bacterium]